VIETYSKSISHIHAHRRLRRALDELFVLAGILSLDGTILEANRASIERAGLGRADVIGRPIWECGWWSYETKAQQQVRDAVRRARSGEVVRYDAPVRVAKGEFITIDFQLAPLRDEAGDIAYLVPSGVDITQRKLAEQALRERTQHLEFLSESESALLATARPAAVLDGIYQRLASLLEFDYYIHFSVVPPGAQLELLACGGLSECHSHELLEFAARVCGAVAASHQPLIVANAPTETDEATESVRRLGVSQYLSYPLLGREGLVGVIWYGRRSVTRIDDTSIALLRTLCDQVTTAIERERAEDALRKSEVQARALAATAEFQHHRLHVALEAVAQGLIIVDAKANPIEVNSSYARMLGFESVAAARLPLAEFEKLLEARFLDGTSARSEDWPVARALRGEFVRNCELEIRRRDTRELLLIASVNAAPVRDASGAILEVVVTLHDITGPREMELRLREADRRKDEFLAILAHELRNPLAPIRTAAEIMKIPGGSEAQRQWSRRMIDRQVQQMARLLDDLLDISRITHGTLELRRGRVSLGPVIETSIETIQPLIDSKHQTLELESPDTSITIEGDSVRLIQILTNLLNNAAKYTPAGGRIHIGAFVEGAEVTLRVQDSGMGMTKEFMGRVFDMFTQARRAIDRAGGGLGIGLAITRGLVELHGGRIEARSEGLGQGSEFIVHLPLEHHPSGTGLR
jgi:PAS domain S-box-containing protein